MLKLSTRSRYAVRIMVYLALRKNERPIRKSEIAEAEKLTPDYVIQLLSGLKRAHLVESRRGTLGGFVLARDAEKISVQDVINAVEKSVDLAPCREQNCEKARTCTTRALWMQADDMLKKLFRKTTIAGLAENARVKRSMI